MISFIKKNKKKVETSLYIALALLVIIAIFQLYGMVAPSNIAGQAYDLENNNVQLLNLFGQYGVVYDPIPTAFELEDTSMHYNWKVNGESMLEVYLPMEELVDDKITDISGNDYIATTNGDLSGMAVSGQSLSFTEQYFEISDLSLESDYTIEMWVNSMNIPFGDYMPLLYIGGDNPILDVRLVKQEDDSLKLSTNYVDTPNIQSLTTWPEAEWYHLIFSFDKNTGSLFIYLGTDQQETQEKAIIPGDYSILPGSTTLIGSDKDLSIFFLGFIDEFKIFNQLLTPKQIIENYKSAKIVNGVLGDTASAFYGSYLVDNMYEKCDDISVDIYQFEAGEQNQQFFPHTVDFQCEDGFACNSDNGLCEELIIDESCGEVECAPDEECNSNNECLPITDCVDCEGTCVDKDAIVDYDESVCVTDDFACSTGTNDIRINFPIDYPEMGGELAVVMDICRDNKVLDYNCKGNMGVLDESYNCKETEQCLNGQCIPAGETCVTSADCTEGICFKPGDEPGKCIDTNTLPKGEAYCIDGVTSIKYLGLDIHGQPKFVLGKCQFAFDLNDDGNGCYVIASSMPGQIYNLNFHKNWVSLVDDNLPLIGGIEGESKDDLYFISSFPKIPYLIPEFKMNSPNVLYSYDGGLMKPLDLDGSTSEFYSDVIDLGTEKLVLVNNMMDDGFFIPMLYKSITTDVGVKWSFESFPTNTVGTLMTQMFSPSKNNLYFLGVNFANQGGSRIIHKQGNSWLTMETALNVNLAKLMVFDLWGTSPDNMYFLGYGQGSDDHPYPVLLHTENNILENQIVEVDNNFEDTIFYSIWGNSENDIYLVGYEMINVFSKDIHDQDIDCITDDECGFKAKCVDQFCKEEHFSGVMYHYNGEWEEIKNTGFSMFDKQFTDVWGDGQGNVYVSGLINGVEKQDDLLSSGIILHKDPDNDWSIKQFDDVSVLMAVHGVCDNCDETGCDTNFMCSITGACVCENDAACLAGESCVAGECLAPVNCIDDTGCTDGRLCLLTDIQESEDDCHKHTNPCAGNYQCNANFDCVMTGACVECRNDADCGTDQKCAGNVCVSDVIIDGTVNNNIGGSSSSSSNNNGCMFPEDPSACSKQKDTTPCVGGKIIYTCDSTCGTSLLYQFDCEGNTASFAAGCNNQIKDLNEEGIDCGGVCTVKCPDHCKNGLKDADETGINCGGKRCAPCEVVVEAKEVQDVKEQPPVLQEPKSNLKWLWLSLIPLVIAIGLVVFLIMRKHHPPRTESFGKSITKEGVTHRDMPKMDEPNKVISKMPPLKEPVVDKPHFNEQELKDFVKGELHSGKNKEDITKSLERLGYSRKEIKNVFEEDMHNVLPPKYETQIRNYILSQLDKGKTPSDLKKLLTKQGWNSKVIDKFLIE
jgi:hypothetical protein